MRKESILKVKTYSTKDISDRLGKSQRYIRQKLKDLSEERKFELGIYINSSGYQVPIENYKKILVK